MDIRLQDPSLQALVTRPKPPVSEAASTRPAATTQKDTSSAYSASKLPTVILDEDAKPQTRLVSEDQEKTGKGFRRFQEFETADGRSFSRHEEFTVTERGSRRLVVQQNASGSTTSLEVVTDKLQDGTFRRTSRFTDETGKTETKIEVDLNAAQIASNITASGPLNAYNAPQSYSDTRGGYVDLST